jgi:hypothetical protein
MAKYLADTVLDGGPEKLQSAGNRVTVCTAQPSTYAEGMTTYALGTLSAASGNYTIGNGDASGRKITWGPGTIAIGTSGTITHVAWLGTAGSGTVLAVGTCASTSVTAAGTVVVNAVDIFESGDIS